MLIKRNQQPVWVHTERETRRTPTRPAGRTPSRPGGDPHGASRVIQARRPIQTELGRCIAIRLLQLPAGPHLQVLVARPDSTTTWFDAQRALTQRQADAWARWGF